MNEKAYNAGVVRAVVDFEKSAFIGAATGAISADKGDRVGGAAAGTVGGAVGTAAGVGGAFNSPLMKSRYAMPLAGAAGLAGLLSGGYVGGKGYSALKRKIQGR